MKKKLKQIEVFLKDEEGIDAIALVEFPAIEIDFLKFNKQTEESVKIVLSKIDTERQVITGPALIPDKMIYRNNKSTKTESEPLEEWEVFFSKDTVRQASERYLIEGKNDSVNLEHDTPLEDISLIESWIVEDVKLDKAAALGFDVPVGTWMCSMKVNNKEVWDELVKTEQVKGFSIEGSFIKKFSKQVDEEEKLWNEIYDILNEVDDTELI